MNNSNIVNSISLMVFTLVIVLGGAYLYSDIMSKVVSVETALVSTSNSKVVSTKPVVNLRDPNDKPKEVFTDVQVGELRKGDAYTDVSIKE